MTLDLARQEAAFVGSRQAYARVTVVWAARPVSAKPGDTAVVTAEGRLLGWVGGSCSEPVIVAQAQAALADGKPRLVHLDPSPSDEPAREGVVVAPVTCASGGALEVFVEPRLPTPHLVVVGRSPMVVTLAAMAALVDFDVVAVEQEAADNPVDGATVVGELDFAKAGVAPDSFVVVATMGRYDEDALEAALATGAHYVALVASAKRAAAVRELLGQSGVAAEDLDRIRAPAGLDLGALPHNEIAVAILADIVAEKARRGTVPADPTAPAPPPREAVDPVCGMTVDPGSAAGSAAFEGTTYWFCASGCRRRFEADPAGVLAAAGGHEH